MTLRDKWAESRERDRELRQAEATRIRCNQKIGQLRAQGVLVESDKSWTEEALDTMLEAEKTRQSELYEAFVQAGTVTLYRAFGVQIVKGDDKVYTIGLHQTWTKTNDSRLLGPVAGAEAQVTDGTSAFSPAKALIMPVGLVGLARKETADAMIVFPDGTVHSVALDGSSAVRQARKECVEYNARAGTTTVAAGPDMADPAAKLQKLKELLEAGLLSEQEYETKRAEVIRSI
jgi:hypothetical protein